MLLKKPVRRDLPGLQLFGATQSANCSAQAATHTPRIFVYLPKLPGNVSNPTPLQKQLLCSARCQIIHQREPVKWLVNLVELAPAEIKMQESLLAGILGSCSQPTMEGKGRGERNEDFDANRRKSWVLKSTCLKGVNPENPWPT